MNLGVQSIFVFVCFLHILRVSPTKSSKDTDQNNQRVYCKFGREPESNQNVLRKKAQRYRISLTSSQGFKKIEKGRNQDLGAGPGSPAPLLNIALNQ